MPHITGQGKVETLRLSRNEYMAVLSRLNEASGPPFESRSSRNRRQQQRVPFHRSVRLLCEIHAASHVPGDAEPAAFIVRCRNISAGGVGFLHGAHVAPDTRCSIIIMDRAASGQCANGRVVHCREVGGGVHEVGVRFDRQIDLSRVLGGPAAPRAAG